MKAYYNEIDRYCCDWLSNLMDAGLITPGSIDDRPIQEVEPDDVRRYDLCHFFAGIAGWDYALRLARYNGARSVWTGSCPCQPFSAAGQGKGAKDERHLWPHWLRLIRECRPAIVFGENVNMAIGWGWLDAVLGDLEKEGYATGAAVLGAHSVGAPHIRQRLWFVADADGGYACAERLQRSGQQRQQPQDGSAGELADAEGHGKRMGFDRHSRSCREGNQKAGSEQYVGSDGPTGELADADAGGWEARQWNAETVGYRDAVAANSGTIQLGEPNWTRLEERNWPAISRGTRSTAIARSNNAWSDLVWLPCSDGRARPAKPSIQPLAHGIPERVAQLRAAGNAIVPQVASEFITACLDLQRPGPTRMNIDVHADTTDPARHRPGGGDSGD